jgi:MinD-like ATPase involved in chromosome partitioning or flagellar assembly
MRKIIIASGKGGVGKSTVALNLTLGLINYSRQAILVDANFNSPNIGLMLGKSNFEDTLISAIDGEKNLKDIIYRHQSSLKIIPGNISLEHLHKKNIPKFNKLLSHLETFTEVVILDSCSGLNKDLFDLLDDGSDVMLVTTPDIISVTETLKLLKVIREKSKSKILGILLNKHSDKSYDMKIDNIQSILGEKIIGIIPNHWTIKESLKLKYPVVYSHPDSPPSLAFEKLACNLIGKNYEEKKNVKKSTMIDLLEKVGLKKWYESLMQENEE